MNRRPRQGHWEVKTTGWSSWQWEEGVMGEAEKGESFTQVGLPKHDCLFTCQFVAFVWASHERQKKGALALCKQDHQCCQCVCIFPNCVVQFPKSVLMLKWSSISVSIHLYFLMCFWACNCTHKVFLNGLLHECMWIAHARTAHSSCCVCCQADLCTNVNTCD